MASIGGRREASAELLARHQADRDARVRDAVLLGDERARVLVRIAQDHVGRHSSNAARMRGSAAVVLSRPKISPTTTSFASSGGSSGTRAQTAPSSSSGGGSSGQNRKPAPRPSRRDRAARRTSLVAAPLEGARERQPAG
jgi:hypothetical protein